MTALLTTLLDAAKAVPNPSPDLTAAILAVEEHASDPRRQAYVRMAKEVQETEGALEIDDNAVVSFSDEAQGAYVHAWVWQPSGEPA